MSPATLPSGRTLITGNEAAAYAVMLARARVIACYPITPQTLIVERLAELLAGRNDVEYANLESEHSMFGYAIAASRVGVRTFTATSSQGLLYAHEQLHRASRERVPLVAVNVNRSVLAPWSLEPDLADSMAQRDTGWIQLYCSSVQEVLDSVICAYRIAESALLPVMVCAEGFLLSHTAEVVEVPTADEVDAFLPPFDPPDEWVLDPSRARTYSAAPEPRDYSRFQRNVAEAMRDARSILATVASDFRSQFGRPKAASIEVTGNPDADVALVTIGTVGDTAQELLDDGDDVLIVRVHAFRPFPAAELASVLSKASRVCVVDRAAAFGSFGPLGTDVRALELEHAVAVTNVICGVGGTEVTPATLRWALGETRSGAPGAGVLEPVYVAEEV
jgi:pyruvate ferredoxin oxidoreductase alpha subunit